MSTRDIVAIQWVVVALPLQGKKLKAVNPGTTDTKLIRESINAVFDEVINESLEMVKQQIRAYNRKFGNGPEQRLNVSLVITCNTTRCLWNPAHHGRWRVEWQRILRGVH